MKQNIGLKRTAVGDKYVLDEMLKSGISLGGEASGHIIFSDLSLAGDGMITLLEVLRLLATVRAIVWRTASRISAFSATDPQRARAGEASAGRDPERRQGHHHLLLEVGRTRPGSGTLLRHRASWPA
jgi:phosphoglucosamine mutase